MDERFFRNWRIAIYIQAVGVVLYGVLVVSLWWT